MKMVFTFCAVITSGEFGRWGLGEGLKMVFTFCAVITSGGVGGSWGGGGGGGGNGIHLLRC